MVEEAEAEASSHKETTFHPHSVERVLEQLLLVLGAIQQMQQQILQFFSNFQVNQAKVSTPAFELVINEPVQGHKPANVGNPSANGRRPSSTTEDPKAFRLNLK